MLKWQILWVSFLFCSVKPGVNSLQTWFEFHPISPWTRPLVPSSGHSQMLGLASADNRFIRKARSALSWSSKSNRSLVLLGNCQYLCSLLGKGEANSQCKVENQWGAKCCVISWALLYARLSYCFSISD